MLSAPRTIGTLRDRHLELMRAWRKLDSDEARVMHAAEFRVAVADGGADISAPGERDEAQGMIDYWASAIAALPGQTYPELLKLTDYQGEEAKRAAWSARQQYEALDSPEKQRIARSILENLLRLGPDGKLERAPPREREVLLSAAQVAYQSQFDEVIAQLAGTGVIVPRPGDGAHGERFEIADANIADNWPALSEWLSERRKFNVRRDRVMAAATRWKEQGRDPDLLLNRYDLKLAPAYQNASETIDAYIAASRRHSSLRRLQLWGGLSGVAILIAASAGALLLQKTRADDSISSAIKGKYDALAIQQQLDLAESVQQSQFCAKVLEKQCGGHLSSIGTALVAADQRFTVSSSDLTTGKTIAGSPLAGMDALTGVIWLGSEGAPAITSPTGGRIGPLGALHRGDRARTNVPVYLRAGLPSPSTYAWAPSKATLAKGMAFELLQQPTSYNRTTGVQYWARVQVIPQVYIQAPDAKGVKVRAIRDRLAELGFDVPKIASLPQALGKSEVRFFLESDRAPAQALLNVLGEDDTIRSVGPINCHPMVGEAPVVVSFRLELWFDPGRTGTSRSAKQCVDDSARNR